MKWMLALLLSCAGLVGCQPESTGSGPSVPVVETSAVPARAAPPATPADPTSLSFLNWSDYIPEGMLADFDRAHGIQTRYTTFSSGEYLHKGLSAGTIKADLVVTTSGYAAEQIRLGLFRPLDKSLLPNLSNLDPAIVSELRSVDPDMRYLVPWAWGYTSIFVNETKVRAALGDLPWPRNESQLLFDPAYLERLSRCGVAMLDMPTEVLPAVLRYLDKQPFSDKPEDYKLAGDHLKRIRPLVATLSDDMISTIASDRHCVAMAWSGDIAAALEELSATGSKDVHRELQSTAGAIKFIDLIGMPASATNPAAAHRFINYYLEGANAVRMMNEMGYPNGNLAAQALVSREVRNDPRIFPGEQFGKSLVFPGSMSPAARWLMVMTYLEAFQGVPTKRS